MDDSRVARHLRIHGHVQGVFFRASTRQRAQQAGAAGWVRNDPDGTVEMFLEGPPAAVDAVETWVRAGGPTSARVDRVDADEREPEDHDAFIIRR